MPRQYMNLADIYSQVDAGRANQAQLQNNQINQQRLQRQFEKEDRAYADELAIKDIYRGAINPETGELDEPKLISDYMKRDPVKALEVKDSFTKRKAEAAETKSKTAKAELENKTATIKYLKDRLATIRDDASYQAFKEEAAQLGATDLVKTAPPQFDAQWQQSQMVNADKFLEQSTPKYEKVDLGGKIQIIDVNPMTNPSIKGSKFDKTLTPGEVQSGNLTRQGHAITIRGQDKVDARAKEANGVGKAPSGYRYLPNGNLEAIPGGPGIKTNNEKLTEGMRSTGQYAARMKAAEKLLEGTKEQAPGIGEKIMGVAGETAANLSRSPDRQKALQAQRDWVRAKLRKESGAAIGVDEMNNEILTYFPQIGDSQAVVNQKKQAREQAVNGMIEASGGAYHAPQTTGVDVRSEADKILGL